MSGPSGSGKTTLLSIAGGLLEPTSGTHVVRRGLDVAGHRGPAARGGLRAPGLRTGADPVRPGERLDRAARPRGDARRGRRAGPRPRWPGSTSPTSATARWRSSPAARCSASPAPAPSSSAPTCCWPTSRPASSTRATAGSCSTSCAPRRPGARSSWWPPTTPPSSRPATGTTRSTRVCWSSTSPRGPVGPRSTRRLFPRSRRRRRCMLEEPAIPEFARSEPVRAGPGRAGPQPVRPALGRRVSAA